MQIVRMFAVLTLAGCTAVESESLMTEVSGHGEPLAALLAVTQAGTPSQHPLGTLPATFMGTLPCADCPGIDVHLNLLADGAYFLRETYQDRDDASFDDVGRYLLSSDNHQITLYGGREAPRRFAVSTPETLIMLDGEGAMIDSELNYSVSRQAEPQVLKPHLLMTGKYRYMADAGRFRECLTGLDMQVATEADNMKLEQAYLEIRETPGGALRVLVEGQMVELMPMEGPGPVWTLVPERFISISPDLSCPEPVRLADLRNTYWRLILIDAVPVQRAPNQREPHLVFHEDGGLTGSDGCNRLIGTYAIDGASLRLSQLGATRMACARGMGQADQLRGVLEKVGRYRIIGQQLEILDRTGSLLLRLEAVALD